MKIFEKIITFTFLCLCILGVNYEVYADESASEVKEYNYSIYFKDNPKASSKESGSYTENTFELSFSTNYEICAYWEYVSTGRYRMKFVKKDNFGNITSDLVFSSYSFVDICNSYNFTNHYIKYYNNVISEEVINGNDGVNGLYIDYYSEPGNLEEDVLNTTFPIFTNEEMALGYFNGTVDITESTNWVDIAPTVYGDLEVPQNIQVDIPDNSWFEFAYDTNISWTQSDENYINWDTEILFYCSFKVRFSILGISFDEWENFDDVFLFNDSIKCRRLKYTITNDKLCNSINDWLNYNTDYTSSTFDEKNFSIFLRNKYFDGSKTHYSNWVKVYVSTPQDGIFEVEGEYNASLEEIDYDNALGDSDKDFTHEMPSGNVNPDSSYNGSFVEDSSSNAVGSFVSYISDGFGLLGDSGLIACVSSALSFVPDFVWVIIGAGISLLVIIAVAKFVF